MVDKNRLVAKVPYQGFRLPVIRPKKVHVIPMNCKHEGEIEYKSWGKVCLECFEAIQSSRSPKMQYDQGTQSYAVN